jgi:hypothetical protein
MLALIKYTVQLVLLAHTFACVWSFVAFLEADETFSEPNLLVKPNGLLTGTAPPVERAVCTLLVKAKFYLDMRRRCSGQCKLLCLLDRVTLFPKHSWSVR